MFEMKGKSSKKQFPFHSEVSKGLGKPQWRVERHPANPGAPIARSDSLTWVPGCQLLLSVGRICCQYHKDSEERNRNTEKKRQDRHQTKQRVTAASPASSNFWDIGKIDPSHHHSVFQAAIRELIFTGSTTDIIAILKGQLITSHTGGGLARLGSFLSTPANKLTGKSRPRVDPEPASAIFPQASQRMLWVLWLFSLLHVPHQGLPLTRSPSSSPPMSNQPPLPPE